MYNLFKANACDVGGSVHNGVWSLTNVTDTDKSALLKRSILKHWIDSKDKNDFVQSVLDAGVMLHGKNFTKVIIEFSDQCFSGVLSDEYITVQKSAGQSVFKQLCDHWANPDSKRQYWVQSVNYSSGVLLNYLIIQYEDHPSLGSMYDYSFKEWGILVKDKIRLAGKNNRSESVAAPLHYFKDYLKVLDNEIEFHNLCFSRMSMTDKVSRRIVTSSANDPLDYVKITFTPTK